MPVETRELEALGSLSNSLALKTLMGITFLLFV
jgi:hypothetical protein